MGNHSHCVCPRSHSLAPTENEGGVSRRAQDREERARAVELGQGGGQRRALRGVEMAQPSASPTTRFNLKNILGSNPPTMNAGRRVPATGANSEKCCCCFELRVGVVTIASIYLVLYMISVLNMAFNSLGWQMQSKAWQGFHIFQAVVGLPLCAVGIYGAYRKRPRYVYAYFLFNVANMLVAFIAAIALLVTLGSGAVSKSFMEECMNDPTLDYDKCKEAAKVTLRVLGAFNFLFAFVQMYWTYAIRRFYMQILIQNAGNFSSYMQV